MTSVYPSEVRVPGTPILDSLGGRSPADDQAEPPQFVPAIVTSPPSQEPDASASPMEVVNTWECAQVEPSSVQEVEVVGGGFTMFVRNPDGSYDLYTGLQTAAPEQENVNIREITLDDGPLVILTRDDEGNLTYDPEDSVTIDIADNSLYVLNTDDGVACYMDNEDNPVGDGNGAGEDMDAEQLIEYLPEEEDPTVGMPSVEQPLPPLELNPYDHVGAEEQVIELEPESFAVGEVAGKRVVNFVCEPGHRPQQQRQPVDLREQTQLQLRLRAAVAQKELAQKELAQKELAQKESAQKELATTDQGHPNWDQFLWDIFGLTL